MDPETVVNHESRYGLTRVGLILASIALGVMAFDAAGHTFWMFTGDRGLSDFFTSPRWQLGASSAIAWSALFGSILLAGRWDTPYWRDRVTILVLLSSVGVLFWMLRHGHLFGAFPQELPYQALRLHLALGFRWAWILVVADLARRVAEHLGHAEAPQVHAVVRALVTIGVVAWLFLLMTSLPFVLGVPMRGPRGRFALFLLQWILFTATRAGACFAATILALLAARECRAYLRERRQAEAHA